MPEKISQAQITLTEEEVQKAILHFLDLKDSQVDCWAWDDIGNVTISYTEKTYIKTAAEKAQDAYNADRARDFNGR